MTISIQTGIFFLILTIFSLSSCKHLLTSSLDEATEDAVAYASLNRGSKFRIASLQASSQCYLGKSLSKGPCGTVKDWMIRDSRQDDTGIKVIISLSNFKCLAVVKKHLIFKDCDSKDPQQNIILINGKFAAKTGKGVTVDMDPVQFFVSKFATADDVLATGPMDMIDSTRQEGQTSSEISYGNTPRIVNMNVCVLQNSISNIQMTRAGGFKEMLGLDSPKCRLLEGYNFKSKEYITSFEYQMEKTSDKKFGDGSNRVHAVRFLTNLSPKFIFLGGSIKEGANWRSLPSPPPPEGMTYMVVGFKTINGRHGGWHIKGISGLFADTEYYQAMNYDVFATDPEYQNNGAGFKGGSLIGITRENSSGYRDYYVKKHFNDIWVRKSTPYSSSYMVNWATGNSNLSTLRVYFSGERLSSLSIRPEIAGGNVDVETYGTPGAIPQIFLEMQENEFISHVYWKSRGGVSDELSGPLINGLQFVTNKGRIAEWQHEKVKLRDWHLAFYKKDHAIVGFHGTLFTPPITHWKYYGIANMGVWYARVSKTESLASAPGATFPITFAGDRMGDLGGGKSGKYICPDNSYIVGINNVHVGRRLDSLTLVCSNGEGIKIGGGGGSDKGSYSCPSGTFVNRFFGTAGDELNSIAVGCSDGAVSEEFSGARSNPATTTCPPNTRGAGISYGEGKVIDRLQIMCRYY